MSLKVEIILNGSALERVQDMTEQEQRQFIHEMLIGASHELVPQVLGNLQKGVTVTKQVGVVLSSTCERIAD